MIPVSRLWYGGGGRGTMIILSRHLRRGPGDWLYTTRGEKAHIVHCIAASVIIIRRLLLSLLFKWIIYAPQMRTHVRRIPLSVRDLIFFFFVISLLLLLFIFFLHFTFSVKWVINYINISERISHRLRCIIERYETTTTKTAADQQGR